MADFADIPIAVAAGLGLTYIKIFLAWIATVPFSTPPKRVQKVVLVEGAAPRALLGGADIDHVALWSNDL